MALSMGAEGAGAMEIDSQHRQAHLPRTVRFTQNQLGIICRLSAVSSPIRFIGVPHAQVVLIGSRRTSNRGSESGSRSRLGLRFAVPFLSLS